MYDHNQTLVPDSFLLLFVRHGRLTAERAEVERRYEFAEDLALHVAGSPWITAVDEPSDRAEALDRVRSGLLTAPAQLTEAEAGWVLRRVAELMNWDGFDPGSA